MSWPELRLGFQSGRTREASTGANWKEAAPPAARGPARCSPACWAAVPEAAEVPAGAKPDLHLADGSAAARPVAL